MPELTLDPEKELNEFLAPDGAHEESEPWRIDDLAGAEWAARILKREAEQMAGREAFALDQMERVGAWLEDARREHERKTGFLRGKLEEYLREQNRKNPRVKSLKLPSGTLALRQQPPKWSYADEGDDFVALLAHARALGCTRAVMKTNDPLVIGYLCERIDDWPEAGLSEEVNRAGLRQHCRATDDGRVVDANGEIVPGVQVETDAPPVFSLRLEA